MTEQKNALTQLFAACWKNEALKARFMSDPKAVLKEHGLDVPGQPGCQGGGERRRLRAHHPACPARRGTWTSRMMS